MNDKKDFQAKDAFEKHLENTTSIDLNKDKGDLPTEEEIKNVQEMYKVMEGAIVNLSLNPEAEIENVQEMYKVMEGAIVNLSLNTDEVIEKNTRKDDTNKNILKIREQSTDTSKTENKNKPQ